MIIIAILGVLSYIVVGMILHLLISINYERGVVTFLNLDEVDVDEGVVSLVFCTWPIGIPLMFLVLAFHSFYVFLYERLDRFVDRREGGRKSNEWF